MGRILVVLHNSPRFLKTPKTSFLDQQAKIVDDFKFHANSSTRECILRCSRDSIRKNEKNYFCSNFDPQTKCASKLPTVPYRLSSGLSTTSKIFSTEQTSIDWSGRERCLKILVSDFYLRFLYQ